MATANDIKRRLLAAINNFVIKLFETDYTALTALQRDVQPAEKD